MRGLTNAAMFTPDGEIVQPAEQLYKKPVLIERGSFRPPTKVTVDIRGSKVPAEIVSTPFYKRS